MLFVYVCLDVPKSIYLLLVSVDAIVLVCAIFVYIELYNNLLHVFSKITPNMTQHYLDQCSEFVSPTI